MNDLCPAISAVERKLPELRLLRDEPMSRHCSFRIGGPAAAMALPESGDELRELCLVLREFGVLPLVTGNGTNLLVTDDRLERFVIKIGDKMSAIAVNGDRGFLAMAGATLTKLALAAQSRGLTGLEFAHGIPGSLGGAVTMNAGAYGGEMKDVVKGTVYLGEDLEMRAMSRGEHGFSYRRSVFSDSGKIILSCEVELMPGSGAEIRERMNELAQKRRDSQPLDKPSAGSTFKRPQNGYAAALIDEAGLKGFSIGGAQVSEKHAGFVINRGGATFDDVIRLMEHVRETVLKRTGICLEPEVKIIRG